MKNSTKTQEFRHGAYNVSIFTNAPLASDKFGYIYSNSKHKRNIDPIQYLIKYGSIAVCAYTIIFYAQCVIAFL